MNIALEGLKEDGYRLGNLQAIKYDRVAHPDLFPDGYLSKLYNLARGSHRRSGDGILAATFGGNPPSNFDAVVGYLAQRPVIVMGEWQEDGTFKEGGFAFPVVFCGLQSPERSMFAGYGFFKDVWGKPELPVMAMLGLSYMFQEFDIKAIHGTRYAENHLTWKFTEQFGFKHIGTIPHYQLRDGKLVDGVVTTLERGDFERYVEDFLVAQYRSEQAALAEVEPQTVEPVQPEPAAQTSLFGDDLPSLAWL